MSSIEALLRASIARVADLDPARLTMDARLAELGVDSLASAEVLVDLEVQLGRQLPSGTLRRLEHVETIADLLEVLEQGFAASLPQAAP